MRRILNLLVVICLIMSFTACKNGKDNSSLSNTSDTFSIVESSSDTFSVVESSQASLPSNEETSSSLPSSSSNYQNDVSIETEYDYTEKYSAISCRRILASQWQTVRIKDLSTLMALQIIIPNDWSISNSGNSFLNIVRDGKTIGILTTSSLQEPKESFAEQGYMDEKISATTRIDWHIENKKDKFYRYYSFICTQNTSKFLVKMRVNYEEIDESAAYKILCSGVMVPKEKPFIHPDAVNGSKKLLILGNSFIGSSRIGEFLNDMLLSSDSGYCANAVSIGMAEVGTYVKNTEICNAIADGEYCYVFMCGFYSQESVENLNYIKWLCESSSTQLVIFPAHNEHQETIDRARFTYDDLCFLDWKGEINALIKSGVDYYDFCINDGHKHSTPLAGYVGAHMIYRTLFGVTPPVITDLSPLDLNYVSYKLGDYIASNGKIENYSYGVYEIT